MITTVLPSPPFHLLPFSGTLLFCISFRLWKISSHSQSPSSLPHAFFQHIVVLHFSLTLDTTQIWWRQWNRWSWYHVCKWIFGCVTFLYCTQKFGCLAVGSWVRVVANIFGGNWWFWLAGGVGWDGAAAVEQVLMSGTANTNTNWMQAKIQLMKRRNSNNNKFRLQLCWWGLHW